MQIYEKQRDEFKDRFSSDSKFMPGVGYRVTLMGTKWWKSLACIQLR